MQGLPVLFIITTVDMPFFSIWFFFHGHSPFTGQQRKGEDISLSPLSYFPPLHRHLEINWAITAENLPLHIASSHTWTMNFLFLSASSQPLSDAPLVISDISWRPRHLCRAYIYSSLVLPLVFNALFLKPPHVFNFPCCFLSFFWFLSSDFILLLALILFFQLYCCKPSHVHYL